jgi:mannosyltransferase OCH1-like enzyme
MPNPIIFRRKNYINNQNKNQKNIDKNTNFVIPANIFQTWHTKILPPLMLNAILQIKNTNPNFCHYLFDQNECREFIRNNFDSTVLNAYDKLVPLAYKADLWRYCILYKKGGIYLDVKYVPINGFKMANLLTKEHFVLDLDKNGIYNALLVCKPGNEILLKAINDIVKNVENKFYGINCLEPTGPKLLWKYFNNINLFDLKHVLNPKLGVNEDRSRLITFNGRHALQCYPGYFKERKNGEKIPHYGELWKQRKVYL